MRTPQVGMVFDRAVNPSLLDLALRVATTAGDSPDSRRRLTVALRDHVSDQEAQGKTKKVLSRIWVEPPAESQPMIRWGIDHQHLDPGHTVLHLGAMLATFPFFGKVASIVGRQIRLQGFVDPAEVKRESRRALGDRSTIDVGARKVLTSLRYLRLLTPGDNRRLLVGTAPPAPPELLGWLAHAVLLTRRIDSVGILDLANALELATIKIPTGRFSGYPLLDIHKEANRTVAVVNGR